MEEAIGRLGSKRGFLFVLFYVSPGPRDPLLSFTTDDAQYVVAFLNWSGISDLRNYGDLSRRTSSNAQDYLLHTLGLDPAGQWK